ncbi:MAG: UDP-N-acetylmuramoyl-L-alanyl-D-glutamate--2,6-diaminopimelate ligase [Candidatus Saccharibacteria bacterium]|nr:UDP-N-acetylmuramoyl-L-alanyl-D-glutamate--2,6-diaminopimelate ligase [Candidatus Saccharibacteria bacterium]
MSFRDFPGYNQVVLPYHFLQALGAGVRYGFPARKLRVIGVTGTNGKTTTCFMIWKMLNEAGCKTGVMTTVGWGVDKIEKQVEHMTTMPSGELNRRIKAIKDAGADFLVLEVTSHAMVQFRTLGIPIEIAVMTNVTREHLDYHKTFDNYVKAKCKLFKKAQFGVVNADDKSAAKFEEAVEDYITYGIKKDSDLQAKEIELNADGVNYSCDDINFIEGRLTEASDKLNIRTQIPGEFNVYNSLAAVAVGQKIGLTPGQIEIGINALESVEGRMNRVEAGQDFTVVVDYAHQPDAFEKVFKSFEGFKGKVITVTGGAGRRDKGTRAERGRIAAEHSDIFIVTEDDSRDEDPAQIAEAFVAGAKKAGMAEDKIIVELNRKKAIEKAVSLAKKGDLVLILGKGHEKTILRADGPHPFEDLKVTKKAIEALPKK